MKKLTLRTEHLGELSTDDLRRVAGAAGVENAAGTISDGSCVCTLGGIAPLILRCDVSDGSCVCTSN
jgi:hypothetical protein